MPVIRTEEEWRTDLTQIIHNIQLSDGYAPIRARQGKPNRHFKKRQVQLWDRRGGDIKVVSACSNLEKKTELIVLVGCFPSQLKGVVSEWFFTGRVAGNSRIKISSENPYELKGDDEDNHWLFTSEHAIQPTTVNVTFENGADMPWGFNEEITGSASFTYDGITMDVSNITRTRVELYAISPSLPDYFRSAGVPLELLRLFVEPACKLTSLRNLNDWVVKKCHASMADKSTLDKAFSPHEVSLQDRIHAFVYDIWHGGPSYAGGPYGRYFNLDSWLDDSVRKSGGCTVNCYDQAAIVQVATLLGVPNGRIRWMFKEPFGYIKEINLVGWGDTNNVRQLLLFSLHEQQNSWSNAHHLDLLPQYRHLQTHPKPEKMLSAPSPFRNHDFVSYRTSSSKWVALDACAGPHTGTETVDEYLTAGIDDGYDAVAESHITTGPKGYYFQEYKKTANSEIRDDQLAILAVDHNDNGAGVTTVRTGTDRSYWWTPASGDKILSYRDLVSKQGTEVWTDFARFVHTAPHHPRQIDLAQFFITFQGKVVAAEVFPGPKKEFVVQRPWYQFLKPADDDGKRRTIFYQSGLDVLAPGVPRPLVSLTVKVMDTADNAVKAAFQWLSCLSKDPSALFTTPVEGEGRRLGHLHLKAKRPNGLNVFGFENILVWVDALDYDVGVRLAEEAEKLVTEATGERDPLETKIETPGEPVKEWDEFEVVVKCDGATDVHVEEDASRFSGTSWSRVGNIWRFKFILIGKGLWTDAGRCRRAKPGWTKFHLLLSTARGMFCVLNALSALRLGLHNDGNAAF